jgi:hypothetical protein
LKVVFSRLAYKSPGLDLMVPVYNSYSMSLIN